MDSLREAAEQALKALQNAEVVYMEQLDAMYALQKALEEPEQKPVAQLQEEQFGRGQVMWFNKPTDKTLLYTAPPKREWVGLTEDEVTDCYLDSSENGILLEEVIEAKLKEKNT